MLTTATRAAQPSEPFTRSHCVANTYFTAESEHLTQLSAENILERIHKLYVKDKLQAATQLFIQMVLRESEYSDAE